MNNLQKVKKIDTLIVGAGQAGLAISEHLSNYSVEHLILEKNRIVESWRSEKSQDELEPIISTPIASPMSDE